MRSLKYLALLLTLLIAGTALALDPGSVYLHRATLDAAATGKPAAADLQARDEDGSWISEADERGERLWVVHFTVSPGERERGLIEESGAEIIGYLPARAYLVEGGIAAAALLSEIGTVDMLAEYSPAWKLSPSLVGKSGLLNLTLTFPRGSDLVTLTDRLRGMGAQLRDSQLVPDRARLLITADAGLLDGLSRLPGLIWLARTEVFSDRNDDIKWIVQSGIPNREPLWDAGLHGEGQVLGHIDSGFRFDNCWFQDLDGNPVGPDHRKVVYIDPETMSSSHGVHTAGTLVGDGYQAFAGADTTLRALSYMAKIAHSKYLSSGYDLYADLEIHYQAGACIHTNSWGASSPGDTLYTAACRDIDRFSHDYEDNMVAFAIMNGSPYPDPPVDQYGNEYPYWLLSPENAKNVLAVGASKAGPYFGEMWRGRRGPTPDGRRKPEVITPGYAINSATTNYCSQTSNSGTSMACPGASSGAGLIRQYFVDGWYPTGSPVTEHSFVPSGALLRATLINSTLPMLATYEQYAGYPNVVEGWGRLALDESLFLTKHPYGVPDSLRLRVHDVRNVDGLETDEWSEIQIEVESDATPLRITMAFTDYPGEVEALYPVVNDLDLQVTSPSGEVYLGNDFDVDAGESINNSLADSVNMVERVIRHAPEIGIWTIRVTGSQVPMGPQGYALAMNGYLATPALELIADYDVITGDQGELLLDLAITPNLPLSESSLTLTVNGLAAEVGELDGGLWRATYPLADAPDLLSLSACAATDFGAAGCLEMDLFLAAVTDGAFTLSAPDGSFRLQLDDGHGLETRLMMFASEPTAGERDLDLGTWCLRPEGLELASLGKGVVEFDFPAGDPADWGTPERLAIAVDGEIIQSYYDLERDIISATISRLGCFTLLGDAGEGGTALDDTFKRLDHNFPNPFTTGTTISFELRQAQRVTLRIYDIAGRETAVLLDGEELFVGPHEIYWNGRNADDDEMASGIYLARLETESAGRSSIRIVLVR